MGFFSSLDEDSFLDLINIPEIRDKFNIRLPKKGQTLNINLMQCFQYCKEILDGTFIDGRFNSEWLSYRSISYQDLLPIVNNTELLGELLKKTAISAKHLSDTPADLSSFLFNPHTGRSTFLYLAKAILDSDKYKLFVERNVETSVVKYVEWHAARGESIYGIIYNLSNWFIENSKNISLVNRNTIALSPLSSLNSFLMSYLETVVSYKLPEITNSNSRIGSGAWWVFVDKMRTQFHVELAYSPEDLRTANVFASMAPRRSTNIRPSDFFLWSIEDQFLWKLQNDNDFLLYLARKDPEIYKAFCDGGIISVKTVLDNR